METGFGQVCGGLSAKNGSTQPPVSGEERQLSLEW